MTITIAWVGATPKSRACESLWKEYALRSNRFVPLNITAFATSAGFFSWFNKLKIRDSNYLVVCDRRGKLVSSEDIAEFIEQRAIEGVRQIVFAIGPPDGWNKEEFSAAQASWSFGRITLPHELALVVASEQIYRALTIRSGHPYHRA